MADKEERIRVEIIDVCKRPKNKDQYKCDCIGSPNEMAGLQVCPIHPQVVAKEGISKQEAIHKIAVALCVADGDVDCDECIYRGTDNCKTQLKNWYLKDAEVALDALLKGGK